MSDARPEMPILKKGDRLTVRHRSRYARGRDGEYVVIRVGRKWAYLVPADSQHVEQALADGSHWTEMKVNKADGYMDGGQYTSPGRAYSDDQLAWEDRHAAAEEYLGAALCRVYDLKPGWRGDRLVELANLIRRHEGLEEL